MLYVQGNANTTTVAGNGLRHAMHCDLHVPTSDGLQANLQGQGTASLLQVSLDLPLFDGIAAQQHILQQHILRFDLLVAGTWGCGPAGRFRGQKREAPRLSLPTHWLSACNPCNPSCTTYVNHPTNNIASPEVNSAEQIAARRILA